MTVSCYLTKTIGASSVEGDRYFTGFYCGNLPDWMSHPCTDGQNNYPDAAIPKDQYDNLKAIAEGRTRIKAVDEWNLLVKEYKRNKTKRQRGG